ncbi:hypothetical protein NPIL_48511 [Nephila pilipes]|uniref:Uncharacterized protein n=1 Tax=Nephila pilipes TaxID=299642 RepID=A0A8X6MLN1_NEPPI|nr:hypothetical protein NPIL_48511 [Nephila pilipes]
MRSKCGRLYCKTGPTAVFSVPPMQHEAQNRLMPQVYPALRAIISFSERYKRLLDLPEASVTPTTEDYGSMRTSMRY